MQMPMIVIFAYIAIAFGLLSIIARHFFPSVFWKLEPMKEKWGAKKGYALHFIGYTLVPLIFGIRILGVYYGWF